MYLHGLRKEGFIRGGVWEVSAWERRRVFHPSIRPSIPSVQARPHARIHRRTHLPLHQGLAPPFVQEQRHALADDQHRHLPTTTTTTTLPPPFLHRRRHLWWSGLAPWQGLWWGKGHVVSVVDVDVVEELLQEGEERRLCVCV